jgi:hypothetical protein
VTVAADEPICIATLLGLELDDFQGNPTMEAIYRSLNQVPSQLLFVLGPRLDVPGRRWAPSTLMTGNIPLAKLNIVFATFGGTGLHFVIDCIVLTKYLCFEIGHRSSLRVDVECSGFGEFYVEGPLYSVDYSPKNRGNLAILLQVPYFGHWSATSGVLVSGFKEKGGITHCRYERPLVVLRKNIFTAVELAWFEKKSPNRFFGSQGDYIEQVAVCVC